MPENAYTLLNPKERTTSVIFASPHSGRDYPLWFLRKSVLDERAIRSSEDAFVDRLFERAPSFGAPLLLAGAPRAFVDLNRAADELDPALIADLRKIAHNPRVASGLGVVPRVVSNGRAIYRGKLTLDEAMSRITNYWQPYHDKLQELMDASRAAFGRAILVDCHSMPHEAIEHSRGGARRADVVLGDRFGAAAASGVVDAIESTFTAAGLRVARNAPFAGAYVAQQYGRPSRGQHVIQVEIDRGLYMDEASVTPSADFASFRKLLTQVIEDIAEIGRPLQHQLAAE
ncbi:MAG: N-formylglutamate amidohydrolase [Rhodobacteraceae bacterium]|nr:N-formylglutamate amidohydrolase [Paracoccaceae bacterium]